MQPPFRLVRAGEEEHNYAEQDREYGEGDPRRASAAFDGYLVACWAFLRGRR